MRKLHKYNEKYDSGRFAPGRQPGYEVAELQPMTILRRLGPLLRSQDPENRRDAQNLVRLLQHCVWCPDGVWIVESVYNNTPPTAPLNEPFIWSAHLTQKNGKAWHTWWTKHWSMRRVDYKVLPLRRASHVPLHLLRHPDAPVGAGVVEK